MVHLIFTERTKDVFMELNKVFSWCDMYIVCREMHCQLVNLYNVTYQEWSTLHFIWTTLVNT